jgi:Rieske 2Fe-2S family protein
MPDSFKSNNYSLKSVNLMNFQGLVFICLADNPPSIAPTLEKLAPLTQPFGLEQLKITHSASYPVAANWKLALENYMECYHYAPSHKEYSKSHSLKDPGEMEALIPSLNIRSEAAGLLIGEINSTGPTSTDIGTDCYYRRYPLFSGYDTGSNNGQPLAPLLGSLASYDGGASDLQIGSLNNFLIYSDHVIAYRFIPTGLQTTDIQTFWLVRGDAEEGKDYVLDDLTWLWHVTTLDDERIIRHNQQGVNSFHCRPGPLSSMKFDVSKFHHG